MSPIEHSRLRAVEDVHWWYATLHRIVLSYLKEYLPAGRKILDAGCGTGGLLSKLTEWDAYGIDAAPAALAHCRQRGLSNTQKANVNNLPFRHQNFDAVLCLDVLYHELVDEELALNEMRRVLRPGGVIIINLPAFECLRGAHDKSVCGKRRYTSHELSKKLHLHKLITEKSHYWCASFFIPLLMWRRWSRNRSAPLSDLTLLPEWLNSSLARFAHWDAIISKALNPPFGTSIFTIARRDK